MAQIKSHTRDVIWRFRQAAEVRGWEKLVLQVLVIAGFISVLRLGDWWFREEHIGNVWIFVLLSLVFWYSVLRILLIWINYLAVAKPIAPVAPPGKKVAIFTTSSPGEPLSMFEKTLEACSNISYPHTTYLLDDTRDPAFRACAERHGAVWLELVGIPGAKAGKINAALALTDEDFILVMDPDHIPFSNFLDQVLGFFEDEKVGFVQVCQAYYNQFKSFTAAGAAEQTYTFYGPTQMGLFGRNCAVAIGANCTFRRLALETAGGHGIGLAEDLITSIRIHAAGWKSVYHPVVVSRGLVPEDYGSFCKQQLKWARGVHEVLFTEVPTLWKRLSFWQRLSYSTIGTYYLTGLLSFVLLLVPFLYLWFGWVPARMDILEFTEYGLPVVLVAVSVYLFVQRWLGHPEEEMGLHWRGMILKYACWPVFLMGFVLSVVNKDIPYIPTAKQVVKGRISPFAKPLIWQVLLFLGTIIVVFYQRKYITPESVLVMTAQKVWGMTGFGLVAFIMAAGGLYAVWDSSRVSEEDAWEHVNINNIE